MIVSYFVIRNESLLAHSMLFHFSNFTNWACFYAKNSFYRPHRFKAFFTDKNCVKPAMRGFAGVVHADIPKPAFMSATETSHFVEF